MLKALGDHHHAAAKALAAGAQNTDAADAAGVSRQTLHKWLKDPGFAHLVEQYKTELGREDIRIAGDLEADWRDKAAKGLAACAPGAVEIIRRAFEQDSSVQRMHLELAMWLVKHLEISAPATAENGAAMTTEELLDLLRHMPPDLLREALELGHVH